MLSALKITEVIMNIQKHSHPAATALAASIMMVMPLTIGYYLLLAGFGELSVSPIAIFFCGSIISMGVSGLLAWGVYKLINRLACKGR